MKDGTKILLLGLLLMLVIIVHSTASVSDVYAADSPPTIEEAADINCLQVEAEIENKTLGFYASGLVGTYYDTFDPDKESYMRLIRIDNSPEFNWLMGSPDASIEPDTFSTNWAGYIEVPKTGKYSFYTYSDDGVRLKIGCNELINRWGLVNLEFTKSNQKIYLTKGLKYRFNMQYQEGPLNSTVFLFWQRDGGNLEIVPPSAFKVCKTDYFRYSQPQYPSQVKGSGNGLKGEYFSGAEGLNSGADPVYVMDGQNIAFEWWTSSPDPSLPVDDFSARWTGSIEAKYTEQVHLQCLADDGIRMWINGEKVLDEWHPNSDSLFDVPVNMIAGQKYSIKIEYNEIGGGAGCTLFWTSAGQEKEIVPVKYLYSPDI